MWNTINWSFHPFNDIVEHSNLKCGHMIYRNPVAKLIFFFFLLKKINGFLTSKFRDILVKIGFFVQCSHLNSVTSISTKLSDNNLWVRGLEMIHGVYPD